MKSFYEFLKESYVSFPLPEDLVFRYEKLDNGGEIIAKSKNIMIGYISYGITDDYAVKDSGNDKFSKLTYNNPHITNVGVHEQFQKQGLASKMYEKLFETLKKEGYDKVFSGRTRNSSYVNNIWEKYADGYEVIEEKKIYYKNLTK